MLKIAPSILAADYARLGEELQTVKAAGADYAHVDVMDGDFVPNLSGGLPLVRSLRGATDLFLDVHLMIRRPSLYAGRFCEAGADLVNVHAEAEDRPALLRTLESIRAMGKKAGMTLKPATPPEALEPFLPLLDLVLIMTVEPGFGGQSFLEDQLPKIRAVRARLERVNPACELEVDGGITPRTAALARAAGANVLVAGSSVFHAKDKRAAIHALRGGSEEESHGVFSRLS